MTADELYVIESIADDLVEDGDIDSLHQLQALFYNRYFGVLHRQAKEEEEAVYHESAAQRIVEDLREGL